LVVGLDDEQVDELVHDKVVEKVFSAAIKTVAEKVIQMVSEVVADWEKLRGIETAYSLVPLLVWFEAAEKVNLMVVEWVSGKVDY